MLSECAAPAPGAHACAVRIRQLSLSIFTELVGGICDAVHGRQRAGHDVLQSVVAR
jgi:hypothetical protein